MSRLGSMLRLFPKLPTIVRTLAHLQPAQARAQLHHGFFGLPQPRNYSGPSPALAMERSVVDFISPPDHVRSRGGLRIELLGTSLELTEPIDWAFTEGGPLFAYHLHQHEYLRLSEFSPETRASTMSDWIRHNPIGVGWDPHPISLRLLCWGKLLATPGSLRLDPSEQDEILRSMASQAETLSHGLEVRLQANHLLTNLVAVVFTGLLLECEASERWLALTPQLQLELGRQVRPDGGHEERSPMYHSLLLENILDLLNMCRSNLERIPSGLEADLNDVASRMLSALTCMTHPDGQISLFADSAFGIASSLSALREYAERLGVAVANKVSSGNGSRHLPQTGYLRLNSEDFDLIASVAGPSPRHQPGHAHCDALAFELSVLGNRLVTDTGLFEYRPGERRDRARQTASHSTLQFDGAEQSEIWAAHRIGGRPEVEVTAWDESGSAEATCRGWSRGAPLHRRFFSVDSDSVSVVDRVEGDFEVVHFSLAFDPAWELDMVSGLAHATRINSSGPACVIAIELAQNFDWKLAKAPYYPTFGLEINRWVLAGSASTCEVATTRFRLVPPAS